MDRPSKPLHFTTRAVTAGRPPAVPDAPLNTPVVLASTYGSFGDLEYGRYANPTWTAFEDALGDLEGGTCVSFASGMAAIGAVLDLVPPGGVVVGSVMSLAGNARLHVNEIAALASGDALAAVDRLVRDGDQRVIGATGVAAFRHFTLRRLTATIESAGGQLLDVAASNWLSLTDSAAVHQLEQHDGRGWAWLLDAEEAMCRESGTVEGGTHMLFAARSANDPPT